MFPVRRSSLPISAHRPVPRAAVSIGTSARAQASSFETTLQAGSTGSLVLSLQKNLAARGFLSTAALATGPGIYGPRTQAAVRAFQTSVGLPATGVAGPYTLAALNRPRHFAQAQP